MQAAVTTPPANVRRMSRDDILRLGRAGRPWEFLPVVAQALRVAPEDAGLRVLAAAAYAKIALRTPALEQLEGITDPAVTDLRKAVEALSEDRVPRPTIEDNCRLNLAALADKGLHLADHWEAWRARLQGCRWFKAAGGNLLRMRDGAWEAFGDHAGAARRFVVQHFGAGEPDPERRPWFPNVTVEGIDPPWLLGQIADVTPRRKDGSWTRLMLVQDDPMEFLDGLSLADLRHVLAEPRLAFCIGPGAADRLSTDLRGRLTAKIGGPVVPLLSVRTRVTPPADAVIRAAEAEQLREHEKLTLQVRARYAGRDRTWWRERFDRAAADNPLRILVPTCRYSTYIRHASADLVSAFQRHGCRAELLIEPDDWSRLSSIAYLRRFVEFEPDLVVLINYTRANMGAGIFPPEVPFVCWIQDAMPHQFSADTGRAQGNLDFVVGHLHPELFDSFAFPRARTLSMPVVASSEKFHPGPVDPDTARRFECEVAFLTHHSETPRAMHDRLCRESGPDKTTRAALELLFPRVIEIAHSAADSSAQARLRDAVILALRHAAGTEPAPTPVTLLLRQYAVPLADRALRHQTLEWAAEVCERRGWRLHLYGRGWDLHPRFGPFARGEVEHGEPLRAAYRAAAVHLHASVTTLNHQRVMECALSGGLPICRLTADAMSIIRSCAQRAAASSGAEPAWSDGDRAGYVVADNPELMTLTALLQRLGEPAAPTFAVGRRRVESLLARPPLEPESRPDWLLIDPAQTTFRSAVDLEARVARTLDSPGWRDAMSAAIARRVADRLTHDVFVRRVLALIRGSF
jgi:hypothetical protein